MATVWMDEYGQVSEDANTRVIPVPRFPLAVQSKTLSGTSQTMTFGATTEFVAVHADGACHINPDVDATTAFKHISGDGLERWFSVREADGTRRTDLRVIQA